MPERRTYNWPRIFAEFKQSGLSQVEFCKQHDLNPKYFSLKRSKHKVEENDRRFAKAVVHPESSMPPGLVLEIGNCKIHCPTTLSMPSLIALVKVFS